MITNSQPTDRQTRLRKAAILVSTLGEPLAEQLLADLPGHDAEEVRLLVASLDGVDQHEFEALLADFQDQTTATPMPIENRPNVSMSGGVELDPSLLARLEAEDDYFAEPPASHQLPNESWQAISDADSETLVEMLAAEQPQTIAVVLARIEPAQAAELIACLPPTMQTEVLTRLSTLDPADEQSLQVVESQLANWISARQQRQLRMSAGRELVDRILQHTPDSQREVLLAKLDRKPLDSANKLPPRVTTSQPSKVSQPTDAHSYKTPANITTRPSSPSSALEYDSSETLSRLESLDDRALLKALQSVDRQTVMIALAGASDTLMKRIVKGLPRRQAKLFRQQVRTIGPTRLSDMVAAQQELVRSGQA